MKTYLHLLIILLMFSCTKPAPQLPSNKGNQADTVSKSLLKINEELIIREDSLIAELIKNKYPDFKKHSFGFWYKTDPLSKRLLLKDSDKCTLIYSLSALNGEKLIEKKITITIGNKEIIPGIEACLKLMSKGDKATIIVPWYLAYGLKGHGNEIAPYTSIVAIISVLEQYNNYK
ncbi:MAG: FKBP-type peptidyl-prolyl cis-trans isomerase [Paludibacter sp.]|nr:FKBP-type peptidyl-prolyl cis-trans isomerase [Paludibacter sp.]